MRVAILSPLFESVPPKLYGGTERVVANLCRSLTESGFEVELFASGDSTVPVKVNAVIDQALRLRATPVKDSSAYNLSMLSMIARRANEFDIIHNHHDYWMLPLSEMVTTPLITTTHGRMDWPETKVAYGSFPNSYFISISNSQRLPIPYLHWVKTIYHGIDLKNFEYRDRPGKYLAFLGRIHPEKRPDWAIAIAQKAGVPLKIAAKIEGPDSQHYFDAFIKPHLDGKWVEYIGEISESEKAEFLGNAMAMVFPIDWPEPFGLVVIESLACGTPVIARPCGAVPELIRDGMNGYLDFNLDVLARRVADLSKISRLNCRKWVENHFSLERMTEDYIHVYRHVAAKKYRSSRHRWNLLHPVQRTANGNS